MGWVEENDDEVQHRAAHLEGELTDDEWQRVLDLSLIHISEPTRHAQISYAVFCLKKE
ncbi:hypothetical protein JMUB7527_28510 [Staphylococcus aureus]